jgi:DNA polymerase-3 subunit alpha
MTYAKVKEWSAQERLLGEKETLGLYLSGHPLERYENELKTLTTSKIATLQPTQNRSVIIAGLVIGLRTMFTKRGDRMAFITLDDRSARIDVVVFSDVFNTYKELISKDSILVIEGDVSVDEYTGGYKLTGRRIFNMEQAREMFVRHIVLQLDPERANSGFLQSLTAIMTPFRSGNCPVSIHYHHPDASAQVALGSQWRVRPSDELLHQLYELLSEQNVVVTY